MKITLSTIKADVGSIGGHTQPSHAMLQAAQECVKQACKDGLLIDGMVTHTGDDIALIMSHTHGDNNKDVHMFAWDTFTHVTTFAKAAGCYAAGQDLLVDAPSSNVRGAGPGVAEITFDHAGKEPRRAEAFMVVAADKCGPGALNLPFFLVFSDPMYSAGLMLPKLIRGFTFEIIDMNAHDHADHIITLQAPDDYYKITMLLRDNERFGIKAIYSRTYNEQAYSASTDRLHNIAGKYTGKDDPIALIRTQGIFPAPEELISPLVKAHFVGGDARGSHVMPIMPVAINTPVTGPYCVPIMSCLAFSLSPEGKFSEQYVDVFGQKVWDWVRLHAQQKAIEIRSQGWSGAAMLPYSELEYSGYRQTLESLLSEFKVVQR